MSSFSHANVQLLFCRAMYTIYGTLYQICTKNIMLDANLFPISLQIPYKKHTHSDSLLIQTDFYF